MNRIKAKGNYLQNQDFQSLHRMNRIKAKAKGNYLQNQDFQSLHWNDSIQ